MEGQGHLAAGRLPQADLPVLLAVVLGARGRRGDRLLPGPDRGGRLRVQPGQGPLGGLVVELGHRLLDRVLQLCVQFTTSRMGDNRAGFRERRSAGALVRCRIVERVRVVPRVVGFIFFSFFFSL